MFVINGDLVDKGAIALIKIHYRHQGITQGDAERFLAMSPGTWREAAIACLEATLPNVLGEAVQQSEPGEVSRRLVEGSIRERSS